MADGPKEWEEQWKRSQGMLKPAAIEARIALTLGLEGDDSDMVKIKGEDLPVIAADLGKLILETLQRMTKRAGW